MLYVDDVTAIGKQVTWHKVFIADTTPADELQQQGKNRGEGPRIMVAREAVPHADAANNRIILDMRDVRSSETDKDGKVITTARPNQLEVLQAQKQEELQVNKTVQEMDTGPLYKRVYRLKSASRTKSTLTPPSNCTSVSRFRSPASCLAWSASRWASRPEKADGRARLSSPS